MATPTLDAYRQLNPQDTRPDQEVVPDLISRLGAQGNLSQYPDLVEHARALDMAYRQAHRPDLIKDFGTSVAGGIDIGQGQLYSAAAQAGDVLGIPEVQQWGMEGFRRNQQEAGQNQPAVASYEDIHGINDALHYGVGLVGQQVPQIGATMAATAGGALLGGVLGGPEGALAGGGLGLNASRGAALGGFAAGYLQNQNYGDLVESGGEDPALTSAIVGTVSGWLETIVPNHIISKAFGAAPRSVAKMGMEELLTRANEVVPGLAKSMLHASVKDSASEALTETAQELVSMAGELYSNRNNPDFEITDKELTDRLINNALGGAVLGSVFGATEGPGHRKEELALQKLAQLRLEQEQKSKVAEAANFITPSNLLLDERYNQPYEKIGTIEPVGLDERYFQPIEGIFHSDATPAQAQSAKAAFNAAQRTSADIKARNENLLDERYNQPHEDIGTLPPAGLDERYTNQSSEKFSRVSQFVPKQTGPFISDLPRKLVSLLDTPSLGFTPSANGDIPTRSIPNLFNKLGVSKAELEIYKAQGLDDLFKGTATNIHELAQWMEDHAPKVEVKELHAETQSSVERELAAQQHALETKFPGWNSGEGMDKYAGNPEFEAEHKKLIGLHLRANDTVQRSDAATGRYGVDPKDLKDMPGAVDLLVRMPTRAAQYTAATGRAAAENPSDVLFRGPHFGESDKNVLASVRAYVEGDTLHVFEVQSDWGQKRAQDEKWYEKRKNELRAQIERNLAKGRYFFEDGKLWDQPYKDNPHDRTPVSDGSSIEDVVKEIMKRESGHVTKNHPLLTDYETLGIKAAIDYAQKKGLKKIAISDGETAMMTEQHDKHAQPHLESLGEPHVVGHSRDWNFYFDEGEWKSGGLEGRVNFSGMPQSDYENYNRSKQYIKDGKHYMVYAEHAAGSGLETVPILAQEIKLTEPKVDQESGMRAAYDQRLPKIAEKLTGDKGERVDFGQHKQGDSKVFDNPAGGKKNNISARVYRLEKVAPGQKKLFDGPRIGTDGKFSPEDLGDFLPRNGPLEFSGDLPIAADLHVRELASKLPALRKELVAVPQNVDAAALETMAREGLRKDENTKATTKQLLAVRDNETGKVLMWGVYQSTGGKLKVDNGVEAKITSRDALATALGVPAKEVRAAYRRGGADVAAYETVWKELNEGAKKDQDISAFAEKGRYTPIAFVSTTEPVAERHFIFNSVEEFKDVVGYAAQQEIVNKGNKGGSQGIPQVLKKLTELSPRDSRGVQILASVLETLGQLQDQAAGSGDTDSKKFSAREWGARTDATLILSRLLAAPRAEKFAETLAKTKSPEELLRRSKGRLFSLFTPEQWEAFKTLTEQPGVKPEQLLQSVDAGLVGYGWPSREAYLIKMTPERRQSQTGEQLHEADQADDAGDNEDNLTAQIVEGSGREGGTAMMQSAENDLPDEGGGSSGPTVFTGGGADRAKSITGFSNIEALSKLAVEFTNPKPENAVAVRNIRDARADSEISSPSEDFEFQAVKDDLKDLINNLFAKQNVEVPSLSTEFLYGIYSNLDKVIRDSQAMPRSYRITSDAVQRLFWNSVTWLGDKGVDVRIVQQNINAQVELLRQEWGRSISAEDGQRIVIVTMGDITTPSADNLRVMFHEIAHQIFADEPVSVQRLMHEAVDRLTRTQLDVFSRTYDDRIKNQTLPTPVLMEEILAEHLSFYGVDNSVARTFGQLLLDGIKKAFARTVLLYGQLRGKVIAPEWAQKYMELRFRDMLDRVVWPSTDFDTLSGDIRNTARTRATFFTPANGGFNAERYDPVSNNFVVHDVTDDSVLASELNLENKLQFSDVVIRDSRSDSLKEFWKKQFGVNPETPTKLQDVLSKIDSGVTDDPATLAGVKSLLESSKFGLKAEVRFVKDAADIELMQTLRVGEGAAAYVDSQHLILINAEKLGGYTPDMFVNLLVHEGQHAATSRAVNAYNLYNKLGQDAEAVAQLVGGSDLYAGDRERLVREIERVMPTVKKVDDIYKHLTKAKDENGHKFAEGEYGLTSLDEFMSETMSNRSFQMKLAKVTLPDSLRVQGKLKSAFKALVQLVQRMLNVEVPGNALESSISATENFILSADFLLSRPSDRVLFAPVTEAESDMRVKKDFEYEYAALNSQADFYHDLFDKAAVAVKQDFDTYVSKTLGIFNPEKSIRELQVKSGARSRPIPINEDLRLNDSKGTKNRIEAETDRKNLTKRLVETTSSAQGRLAGKMAALKNQIPQLQRQLEKTQERFVRFETMLHDVTTIRDNALKILRKGLRGAERSAQRLVQWSTRHDGLAGVAAELFGVATDEAIPEDYAELVMDSVEEHADDFFITDTLTAATKHNIDFDLLTPTEIEAKIKQLAVATRDPNLIPLADGSPLAKANLALLIYYAKTAPEDMVALSVRVEKDPERKEEILATIRKIIRGNYESTTGLNDLFKDVRKGDVRVGKAKSSLTAAAKSLSRTKALLDLANLRTAEMEKAAAAIATGAKPFKAELGIRATRFEPHNGAAILLTKNNEITKGTLKLGPDSSASVNQILMDNVAWINAHKGVQDETYFAIQDQIEGLKKVAGEQIDRDFRDSWMTRFIGSLPERLKDIGIPILRQAADRLVRNFSLRQEAEPIITSGYRVTEDFNAARKATGFENSYQGFKDTIWNPSYHFLRHLTLVPGATEVENRAFAKEQLRQFFMRNEVTREMVKKAGAYDSVWTALETNARVSKSIANKAAAWNVFVEDSEIRVVNPRTGRLENALRPAMDVGLMTTQTNIRKIFAIKDLLDSIKDPNGGGPSLWAEWTQNDKDIPPALLFTPEALRQFVAPFIYDTGTLHLNAPALLDGRTRNRANPLNVQTAFEAANGDMTKFASLLFDSEYTLGSEDGVNHDQRRTEFVTETLDFFKKQYKKIYNMSKTQESFDRNGVAMLATPMMDSIKAMDFPPEFVDSYVYDHITVRNIMSQLAAHGSLGRDLGITAKEKDVNGGVMWELRHAEEDLRARRAEYDQLVKAATLDNPHASKKEIDAYVKNRVGESKFTTLKNIDKAQSELDQIQRSIMTYFTSPNGATRDMTLAQTAVGTLTGMMVNNFKSTINSVSQAFEPFMLYGIGKTGWKQSIRYLEATASSGAGSFIQAISGQAKMASEYARYMSELGLGRDAANEVTSAQIIADTGKNNAYEDRRLLGWLRKGRSLAFDTGFRGAEGERIAPKFRPQAPFSMMMIALNQGAIESELRLYDDVLKQAIKTMDGTPGSFSDPAFQFTNEHIKLGDNTFDSLAFDELKEQFRIMGTTLEVETRSLIQARDSGKLLGNIVVPPNLARLIAGEALRRMSLPSDISASAVWMHNSPLGRLAMPLISWGLNKTNQLIGAVRAPNGESNRRAMVAGIASLALGMVPAAILISLLTDQYDERILGKKSNLVGFNFDSPSQTAVALMDRVGRVGTFGMAGDLVNGVRAYGASGDMRGISIDQRVVFVNTLMSMIGLASTAYNQEGTLTYDSFYRPLLNTMGGGGILQNQQILNNITNTVMGVPIFQAEAETTARLNALNYLRGGGRVTGLDVRTGSGMKTLPNPIKPWIGQMVVATYGNNRSEFVDAYNKAIVAAREEGKPDPVAYVKSAYEAYHPLRYTFSTPPSPADVGKLMGALTDKGRADVSSAINAFNAYGQTLGIKPYEGKVATTASTKVAPNPWQTPKRQ